MSDEDCILPRGITSAASKWLIRYFADQYQKIGEAVYKIDIEDVINANDLWLVDEWTHLGNVIVICCNNPKLVESYKKGNTKLLDSLLGLTIKYSNMTVDPTLIRELIPLVIEAHF